MSTPAKPKHPNTFEGVKRIAKEAGARYPELVAAQWAVESGWGKAAPGHNYFGLKSATPGAGQKHLTQEERDGAMVTETAEFMTFASLEECVNYLVRLWYKDYEGYKGVNNAADREAAARMLESEGYATDSQYAEKLIKVMDEMEPVVIAVSTTSSGGSKPKPPAKPAVLTLRALQDTWLKKTREAADDLGEKEKVAVAQGKEYGVAELRELPGDAHAEVVLAGGAGTWFVFEPHWETVQGTGEAMPAVIDWNDFGCLITPHLSVGEVLQWDKRRKPSGGAIVRILKTAAEFEKIRLAWGAPLGVTSWYRPEPINAQVGGVPGSRHTTGEAFDIYPVGRSLDSFYEWIRRRWTGGLGDGRNKGFLHLDTRNGGHFVPGAGATPYTTWLY
jgi:hypothetical protein